MGVRVRVKDVRGLYPGQYVVRMQGVCRTYVDRMQGICRTYVVRIQAVCRTYAGPYVVRM